MNKLQIYVEALWNVYGCHAAFDFEAAWQWLQHLYPADEEDMPFLFIGGHAPYGKYRGSYNWGTNVIHIPTVPKRSVARVTGGGVISVGDMLRPVIAHELMHFLEAQVFFQRDRVNYLDTLVPGTKDHTSSVWVKLVCSSEALSDPKNLIDGGEVHKLMCRFPKSDSSRRLHQYLRSYLPSLDSQGGVVPRESALLELYQNLKKPEAKGSDS